VLFSPAPQELFGKAVTVYNLLAGFMFMVLSWRGGWKLPSAGDV
jgi:hypothetical protein